MSVNTTTTADGQAPAKQGVSLPEPAAATNNAKIMRTAGVILLAIGIAAPFLSGNFLIFQLTMMMIYAIAILGLNILTGINGQFSLGHGAFYAVGAYTAAIMMDQFGIGYLWTLPVAGIICFVVGFLFGLPALRLEGVYLALATFALAVVTPQLFKLSPFEHWTSGVMGIVISKPEAPFRVAPQSGPVALLPDLCHRVCWPMSAPETSSAAGPAAP
jgi:branched-chain amino acid transport system permease protein